jgi:TRAP-type mannitol/chloroaromatic compound transport system permease small subunit
LELLDRIYRVLERVSLWAVWAGGFALLLAAIMIVIEIVGRKIGGTDVLGVTLPSFRVPGSDEYSGYVFAGATTWAYAYCLIHRSHIRIDALYNLFPAPIRAVLDVIGLALLGVYVTYLTERAWVVFIGTLEKGSRAATPQQTPLWLPQAVWVTGLTFFTIVTIFVCFYALVCLVTGRTAQVQRLAGTMSVDEEVAADTKGVREMKS